MRDELDGPNAITSARHPNAFTCSKRSLKSPSPLQRITFLALCAFYWCLRDRFFLCGLFTACAFLTRFPLGLWLVLFPLIFFFEKKRKNAYPVFLLGFLLPVTIYCIFNLFTYGDAFSPFLLALEHQANALHIQSWWYYFIELPMNNLFFLFFPLIFLFFRKKYIPIILPILFFGGYFLFIINTQLRFMIIILPFIALCTGYVLALFTYKKHIPMLLLFFLFALFPLAQNGALFVQRMDQDLGIYPSLPEMEGPVFTLDPIPAVYQSTLFVPFYTSVDDALQEYGEKKSEFSTVFYNDAFYPCMHALCRDKKHTLRAFIQRDFPTIAYYHPPYAIFSSGS